MASQAETYTGGEFIWSEAEGERSRDNITIAASAGLIPAGRMVGAVTPTSTSAAKSGGNTGNGTMGAITTTIGTRPGVWTVRITVAALNAGTFELRDPGGILQATGTVAVAFNQAGLAFTLADGTTDFIVGDGFDITVPTTLWTNYDDSLSDGTQQARGVLCYEVDATAAVNRPATIIARKAELVLARVDSKTAGHKAAGIVDLNAVGIFFR